MRKPTEVAYLAYWAALRGTAKCARAARGRLRAAPSADATSATISTHQPRSFRATTTRAFLRSSRDVTSAEVSLLCHPNPRNPWYLQACKAKGALQVVSSMQSSKHERRPGGRLRGEP